MKKFYFFVALFISIFIFNYHLRAEYMYEWMIGFFDPGSNDLLHLTSDNKGNIYAIGEYCDSINIGQYTIYDTGFGGMFVAKLDKCEGIQWITTSNCVNAGSYISPNSIVTDTSGNIYCVADFSGTVQLGQFIHYGGSMNFLITKIDSLGNFIWAKSYGGAIVTSARATYLAYDGEALYISGDYLGHLDFGPFQVSCTGYQAFAAKMDKDGNECWINSTNGDNYAYGNSITVCPDKKIFLAGDFYDNIQIGIAYYFGYEMNVFVAALDSIGNFMGSSVGVHNNNNDFFTAGAGCIECNHQNEVFIIGGYNGSLKIGTTLLPFGSKSFVAKVNSMAHMDWAAYPEGPQIWLYSIKPSIPGNWLITGCYSGSAVFGNDTLNSPYQDLFLSKFSSPGEFKGTSELDLVGRSVGTDLAYSNSNDLFLSGEFYDTLTNGIDTLVCSQGVNDRMLLKFDPNEIFDLKAFLQGPFEGQVMSTCLNQQLPLEQPFLANPWNYHGDEKVYQIPGSDIVDWILVEVREVPDTVLIPTMNSIVAKRAGFIRNDGKITDLDGVSPLRVKFDASDYIYTVLYHRNHLGIMTSIPVTKSSGVWTYDFTTNADNFFGGINGCTEISPGIFGMTSGDAVPDGNINIIDKNDSWIIQAGLSGYLQGDMNMDSFVNNADKIDDWIPNSGKSCQVPD